MSENATLEKINKEYWMKIRHPYSCGIEITPLCNMKCIHCYLQDYELDDLLRFDDIKRILDILFDKGVLAVYFTGGEILTHPDFFEIYTYAKRKGFIVDLLSNITLLNEKHIQMFNELPPSRVSISIYGANENTYKKITRTDGSFAKAMHGLELLHEAGLHFDIKFIALQENIEDFHKVEEIAKRYEVPFSHTFEMFSTLNGCNDPLAHMLSVEEIIKFEKEYDITITRWASQCNDNNPAEKNCLFFCDIARSNFIIDCEGYMEPCNKLRTKEYKLLEHSFDEIWNAFGKYKQMEAPSGYKCGTCEDRGLCMPCPAENLLATGSMHIVPRSICELSHARRSEFSKSEYNIYRK